MDQLSVGVAFVAGIFSFLSPCVLPLVPAYISFLSGVSLEELKQDNARKSITRKAGLTSVFFVLGFSVVFIAMGASASFIGKLLSEYIHVFTKIAGVVIVILGLHLIGVFRISWLGYERRLKVKKFSPGLFGAFVIGLAFAFGWTPCVGPILAGILALAAAQQTLIKGIYLLAVYSLGLGIPFIITGFAVGSFIKFLEKYKKFIMWTEVIAGLLLVLIGVLIFFDRLSVILKFVPSSFFEFAK
jgi:cytochrome c-type biogenesis protein